ncbi:MAG: Hpt domain-containing protein [Oceanidesulfovibrio sp.]
MGDHLEIMDTLARLGGDVELLGELYVAFSADAPTKLEKLDGALARRDLVEARKQAHALKGAAAAIGALSTRTLAERMEKTVNEISADEAGVLQADLANEVHAAIDAMDQALEAAKK